MAYEKDPTTNFRTQGEEREFVLFSKIFTDAFTTAYAQGKAKGFPVEDFSAKAQGIVRRAISAYWEARKKAGGGRPRAEASADNSAAEDDTPF